MDVIFQETTSRHQCGCEFSVNECRTQCTFSSSTTVTIPNGWTYFDGKFEQNENAPDSTFSICQNHKARLKNALSALNNL